jgi:ABC-2 type transport system ATP-binding protein
MKCNLHKVENIMLQVDSISKTFSGGFKAVNSVSLSVNSGEIVGVLGPNGAGKTTTIRMILNIIAPDQGSIRINGKHSTELSKDIIGYLPEERGLYKKSTIGHTLAYFGSLKGMDEKTIKQNTAYWLERFNLGGMEKRKVEELSKGNQQKVQFIAAVLHNPSLLILDEPFSGLDPINQVLFKEAVSELKEQGKAIIFCTHQLESAETFCDTFFLINKGERVLYGTLHDIRKDFYRNECEVGFLGDVSYLSRIPHTTLKSVNGQTAILEYDSTIDFSTLVKQIADVMTLTRIAKIEPSLLHIFMSVIQGNVQKSNTGDFQ